MVDLCAPCQVEGEKHPRKLRVDQFPLGSVLMNQLMQILMAEVQRVPVLKRKLFQANFHTTLSGEAMVGATDSITSPPGLLPVPSPSVLATAKLLGQPVASRAACLLAHPACLETCPAVGG